MDQRDQVVRGGYDIFKRTKLLNLARQISGQALLVTTVSLHTQVPNANANGKPNPSEQLPKISLAP